MEEIEKRELKQQIKAKIAADQFQSEIFQAKGQFLMNNDYLIYDQIDLDTFLEYIYFRDGEKFGYPFEETMCKEYIDWRRQKDAGQEIIYQPDQDFKYNAILMALRRKASGEDGKTILKGYSYILTQSLDKLDQILSEENDAVISSPITYIGLNRTAKNARYIYALAFDIDGVGMDQIRDLLYQMMNNVIPTANIIVNSGNGLHLYYIFKKPIALFKNAKETLAKLKHELTIRLWNQYTSTIKKKQFQGIFQGFRMPGSRTKRGEVVQAYLNHKAPLYSVEDLCRRVSDGSDRYSIQEIEWKVLDSGKYSSNRTTLRKAKAKWPEWYEKVIVRGDKTKGRYYTHRGLYDWWLKRLKDPLEPVSEGHRYFCLLALSMFAVKCGIDYDELKNDAYSLVEQFDKLTTDNDNHFTFEDAEDALKAYKSDFYTFPKNSIEYLTGLPMPKNKRNGRKQKLHLILARGQQELLCKIDNRDWRAGNGRPKGTIIPAEQSPQYRLVQNWRKANPKSTNKSLCARETGLSRSTVHKWWEVSS